MVTQRCVIQGDVQGVGFRWFVVRNAREVGVRGTVRNRADGAVEAILQADSSDVLETLVERLRRGPRSGRVDEVTVEPMEDDVEPFEGFEVVW